MNALFWMAALVVIGLDQGSKQLVLATLPALHDSRVIWPGVLAFTHVENSGIAFGMLRGQGWGLIAISAAAAAGIVYYWRRLSRRSARLNLLTVLGLALPLGGAVGNLLDRIRLGQVTDFIDFGWWPVFNLADTAITVGAVLFALACLLPAAPPPVAEPAADNSTSAGG